MPGPVKYLLFCYMKWLNLKKKIGGHFQALEEGGGVLIRCVMLGGNNNFSKRVIPYKESSKGVKPENKILKSISVCAQKFVVPRKTPIYFYFHLQNIILSAWVRLALEIQSLHKFEFSNPAILENILNWSICVYGTSQRSFKEISTKT